MLGDDDGGLASADEVVASSGISFESSILRFFLGSRFGKEMPLRLCDILPFGCVSRCIAGDVIASDDAATEIVAEPETAAARLAAFFSWIAFRRSF